MYIITTQKARTHIPVFNPRYSKYLRARAFDALFKLARFEVKDERVEEPNGHEGLVD